MTYNEAMAKLTAGIAPRTLSPYKRGELPDKFFMSVVLEKERKRMGKLPPINVANIITFPDKKRGKK